MGRATLRADPASTGGFSSSRVGHKKFPPGKRPRIDLNNFPSRELYLYFAFGIAKIPQNKNPMPQTLKFKLCYFAFCQDVMIVRVRLECRKYVGDFERGSTLGFVGSSDLSVG